MTLTPAEYTAALRAAAALHPEDCPCSTCKPHLPDESRQEAVTARTDHGRALSAALRNTQSTS